MIPAYAEVIIYDFGSIDVCALTCQQLLEQMEARTMTAQIKSWSVDATRVSEVGQRIPSRCPRSRDRAAQRLCDRAQAAG